MSFMNILLKESEFRVSVDPDSNLCFVLFHTQQFLPSVLLSRSCFSAEMLTLQSFSVLFFFIL